MNYALRHSALAFLVLPLFVRADVRVEIFEFPMKREAAAVETFGGNDSDNAKDDGGREQSWAKMPPNRTDDYAEHAFAFAAITNKFTASGVRTDRSRPFLVRATATITLPPGEHTLHLRALGGSRLAWDGAFVVETPLTTGSTCRTTSSITRSSRTRSSAAARGNQARRSSGSSSPSSCSHRSRGV